MTDIHPRLGFVEKLAVKLRFLHLGKDMLNYRRFRVPLLFPIRGQRTTEESLLTRSVTLDDSVLDLTAGGGISIYSNKDVDIDVSAVIPVAPYSTPVKSKFKDSADISTNSVSTYFFLELDCPNGLSYHSIGAAADESLKIHHSSSTARQKRR